MRRFTALFDAIDGTTRTSDKVAALVAYFREAPPADAAWALWFLSGHRVKRAVPTARLREWTAEESGLPAWLVEESYHEVGDLAETAALLVRAEGSDVDIPFERLVEERVLTLPALGDEERRAIVTESWQQLDARERLVYNKLVTGGFRVGVAALLVQRAVGEVAGLPPATIAHRLMGDWSPTPEGWARLVAPDDAGDDPSRPYPFMLAHPLEQEVASLGAPDEWQVEWKWDGIRAQLIRRAGRVVLWSRGEESIAERFPEIAVAAQSLPDGTVLDGEVLAWRGDRPLPFARLQRRIGRTAITAKVLSDAPAVFLAYDLLEDEGVDRREAPMAERRARLEALLGGGRATLRLSPLVEFARWEALPALMAESRDRGVEGFMLKRRDSPYRAGRRKGDWWKWKVDPFHVDAVLLYAQPGHGRRASLFTDYTFGVWHEGALVPIAKAYSGLTDAEIREVDAFVRRSTTDRFGPVRAVQPELVFELAFEGIQASPRHKAGIALRFPRMARWRKDKPASGADTLESLRALLAAAQRHA